MAYSSNAILTKARAMYGKRMTEEDFHNIVNLSSVSEVANFLSSNTQYSDSLQSISSGYVERSQLENALKKHMFNQFESLAHFEKAIGQEIYKYFIIRNEIDEIVSCIRYLKTPNADEYLMKMPSYLNKLTTIDLFKLASSQSYDDIIKSVEKTDYEKILQSFYPLDGSINLPAIESTLIKYLVEKTEDFAKKSLPKKEREEFLKCVRTVSDIKNIQNVFRLKFIFNFPPERIETLVLSQAKSNLDKKEKENIILSKTEEEFWQNVDSTLYGSGMRKIKEYSSIESKCSQFLVSWAKRQLRFSVYPSVVMFAWMLLSENEINNIIYLTAGIQYKVPAEELLKNLNLPKEVE